MKNAFDDVILCRGVSKLCCLSVFARNPIFLVTHLQSSSLTLLEVDREVIDTAILKFDKQNFLYDFSCKKSFYYLHKCMHKNMEYV